MNAHRLRLIAAGAVMAFVLTTDRVTKLVVLARFRFEGETVTAIPGFLSFTYRRNPGSAFSMFHSVPAAPVILTLIALAAVTFIGWLLWRQRNLPMKIVAGLGAIAGGAIGNCIDRVFHPHTVVDFIDCFAGAWHWPAFNIADSAICIGAGLLVLASFTDPAAFSRQARPHLSPGLPQDCPR